MKPTTEDVTEAILNRTWRPTLSYIGESGMPDAANAGNVLRPFTTIVVSFRLPPRVDGKVAMEAVKKILEENPPYNAKVTFEYEDDIGNGWDAPEFESWLEKSYDEASNVFFGSPANFLGVGGSIPLIDLLGRKYPKSQFCVTGVGAPGTNAHGVNENLSIPLVKKGTMCSCYHVMDQIRFLKSFFPFTVLILFSATVTMCVAKVVNDHAIHHNK
jgi:acetylornithine deacetylase/succinyl-diaminopimelate desuccinylase-like protein